MDLTNAQVIDKWKGLGSDKTACAKWLEEICDGNIHTDIDSLRKSVGRLVEKYQKCNKRKGEKLENLLSRPFIFPDTKGESSHTHICTDSPHCGHEEACQLLAKEVKEKEEQLEQSQDEVQNKDKQLMECQKALCEKDEELKETQIHGCMYKEVTSLKRKLEDKTKDLRATDSREAYHREKRQREENINMQLRKQLEENEKEATAAKESLKRFGHIIEENKKELKEYEETTQYLQTLLEDDKLVHTIDSVTRTYTPELCQCVYELLEYNVSASKVGDVIVSVLKLVGKKPTNVPSKSTVLNMNLQRLSLSQQQVSEVLCPKPNITLLTDETSKRGAKYMGYEASDSDGNMWVLGLRDITTKSAQDTLDVLKEILSDIDLRSKLTDNSKSKALLTHIIATMSDRAQTEIKFNALLEEYRSSILPTVIENYDDLPDDDKKAVASLSNFFCGLHSLVHIAETSKAALKEAEGLMFDGSVPNPDPNFYANNEPGTVRLVRTAAKAFAPGADEKSGCYGQFIIFIQEFLKHHKLRAIPLESFRGSRFNILFSVAMGVYFLKDKMTEYLEQIPITNKLLKSVYSDLKVEEFVAGLKALGLICKLITCPLWNIIERKNVNILDMNTKYQQLVTFCTEATDQLDRFLTGDMAIFEEDTYIDKDCIWEKLIEPSPYDGATKVILGVILPAVTSLCKRIFADHLPGGKYSELDIHDQRLRDKFQSVPKSSKFAESVFGLLDYQIRMKPNVTTLAVEASIMFSQNKTRAWLEGKTANLASLVTQARKDSKKIKQDFQKRRNAIIEERRRALQEKMKKEEESKKRLIAKHEGYTRDMMRFGLWQSESEVDNHVNSYATKKLQKEALTAQLRFRQKVLHQDVAEPGAFSVSKKDGNKRSNLTVDELKAKVKKLICEAVVVRDGDNDPPHHILTGKRIRHRVKESLNNNELEWRVGNVINQVNKIYNFGSVSYQ